MFHHGRNIASRLSFRSVAKAFATNSDVCGAGHVSARDRRSLLASPYLAQRDFNPQARARCGDDAGAAGKESRRLPAQLSGAGRLLATAADGRTAASGDGSHGPAHEAARRAARTLRSARQRCVCHCRMSCETSISWSLADKLVFP